MSRAKLNLRRFLYLLLVLGAAVLIGFRGGVAAWLVFWASLLPLLLALVWRLLGLSRLWCSVRIERSTPEHGEVVDCVLLLANDGPLPLTDLRLRLTEGKLHFSGTSRVVHLSLAPGESQDLHLSLECSHCGDAVVGAEEIWALDPFGLFRRRLRALTELQVHPRTVHLERLLVTPPSERENRRDAQIYAENQIPNGELRDYFPGDDLRRVNWKVSALQRRPVVRVLAPEDRDELVLLPDARPGLPEGAAGWRAADSVLEGTLAIADYMLRRGIPLRVMTERENALTVRSPEGLKRLQVLCAGPFFSGSHRPDALMELDLARSRTGRSYVILTWQLDEALLRLSARCIALGAEVTLIYVGEDPAASAQAAGVPQLRFHWVTELEDIMTLLGGEGARS